MHNLYHHHYAVGFERYRYERLRSVHAMAYRTVGHGGARVAAGAAPPMRIAFDGPDADMVGGKERGVRVCVRGLGDGVITRHSHQNTCAVVTQCRSFTCCASKSNRKLSNARAF